MTPKIGTRLGPYEILALLGTGGMGEVYGARDSNFQRESIKVLPQSLARSTAFARTGHRPGVRPRSFTEERTSS